MGSDSEVIHTRTQMEAARKPLPTKLTVRPVGVADFERLCAIATPVTIKGPQTEEQKWAAMQIRLPALANAAAKKYTGVENMMEKLMEDSSKELDSYKTENDDDREENEHGLTATNLIHARELARLSLEGVMALGSKYGFDSEDLEAYGPAMVRIANNIGNTLLNA